MASKEVVQNASEFYQIFLSNKLGEKVQVAMLSSTQQSTATEDKTPPHFEQMRQKLLMVAGGNEAAGLSQ